MAVEVEDFEPDHGPPGTPIKVYGSGFADGGTTTTIFFINKPATSVVISNDTLQTTVPQGARTGVVTVENKNGTGRSSLEFKVDDVGPVHVQSFQPTLGPTGLQVKIYGAGFQGFTRVLFGTAQATTVRFENDGYLIATVPQNAKTGKIQVQTPHGNGTSVRDFQVTGKE